MPDIQFRGVKAQEAIDHIRQKTRIPTDRFDAMLGEPHAKAFTVAGAIQADLLKDLHDAVIAAIENGESIGQFRGRFDEIVHKHGWSFKGEYGWRTRVIYDNNLRTAHMAGRWKQIERNKQRRPYLIYMTVGDERVRETHRSWHKLAAKVDDAFWNTHYPPNGWGCRCYTISATQRQVDRMGVEVVENPGIERTERINTSTGEVYGEVPVGIDTGWDYNVGKAWLGPDRAFGEKAMKMPAMLREPMLNQVDAEALNTNWQEWLKQVDADPHPRGYIQTVGFIDNAIIEGLAKHKIVPNNAAIAVYDNQTAHLRGDHKADAKSVSEKWFLDLPLHLSSYEAVLLHKGTKEILIVMPDGSKKRTRAVVQINFTRKGLIFNSLRSLGVMDARHLGQDHYEVIAGSLE